MPHYDDSINLIITHPFDKGAMSGRKRSDEVLVLEIQFDCGLGKKLYRFLKKHLLCCYIELEKEPKSAKIPCPAIASNATRTLPFETNPATGKEDLNIKPNNSCYGVVDLSSTASESESECSECFKNDYHLLPPIPESSDEQETVESNMCSSDQSSLKIDCIDQKSQNIQSFFDQKCSYDSIFDVSWDIIRNYENKTWTKLVLDLQNPDGSYGKIRMNKLKLKSSDGSAPKSIISLYTENCPAINLDKYIKSTKIADAEIPPSEMKYCSSIFV